MEAPFAIVTLLVLVSTCIVSILAFNNKSLEQKYIFSPRMILGEKQYFRLISSAFLHANGRHLVFNMYSLYVFGSSIEMFYGGTQFLMIYLAATLGGSLLSLWLHRHHDYLAYGASGGVCGIIYAHIFLFPGGSIGMAFMPFFIPSWLYAVIYMVYSIYSLKNRHDNVGHDAHLGGAILGLLTATALHPTIATQSPWLFTTVMGISVLLLIYLVVNPMFLPMKHFADFVPSFRSGKTRRDHLPSYQQERFRVDDLLEKIAQNGKASLTQEELAFLQNVSQKYQKRAESKGKESDLII